MDAVTFAACRRAARAVRAAECGAEATAHLRPRSAVGLARGRGPMSVLLYNAAREGRLVWQSPASFAVLELPAARRPPHLPLGLRGRLLRLIDRRWDVVVMATPPLAAMLAATVLALFGTFVVAGLWLVVGAMAYVAMSMTARVVADADALRRILGRTPRTLDSIAAESLPGWNWSVPLLHDSRDRPGRQLIDRTASQMNRLVQSYSRQAGQEWGGESATFVVREVLVFTLGGVTTRAMRSVVRTSMTSPYGPDSEVFLRLPTGPVTGYRKPQADRGGFLPIYLLGVAAVLLSCAVWVAEWERNLCAATTCAGRPADFVSALHWLAWQLVFRDPPGLAAQAPYSLVIGWLLGLLGLVTLPVTYLSVSFAINAQRASRDIALDLIGDSVNRARMLLLTVTPVERDAVLAAVKATNGFTPVRSFEGNYVIYELGTVSDTRVAMVQVPRQGANGPGGATLAAAEAIRRWGPDFVIMVGICFGLGDKWEHRPQKLGDVLMASSVYDLDRKIVFDDREELQGDRAGASAVMVTRIEAASTDWPLKDEVTFSKGLMLASGVLVSSAEYSERLRRDHSRAIGGDMEGHALYAAAAEARVPWLLVKAISDWGRERETYYEPEKAAANSASLVVHALDIGAFDDANRL
ncbi:hypothetical protein ACFQO7_22350 [Catellatospora aurea]|uniref:Nucleoside phosphorylase domain-containing protein n=1 Tax=Catellatospora aurea TaxID=1337874 RepID=A0ABW2H2L5_9ACTN